MDLGLKGKTALITGASKGIGRGVAEALAAEGCHVRLVSRSLDLLETAVAEITRDHGVKATAHAADLSDSGAIDGLLAGDLPDILVNNAGAIPGGDIETITEEICRFAGI